MNNFNTSWKERYRWILAFICLSLCSVAGSVQAREGLILQVSDDNPQVWNMALNIAKNAPNHFREPLEIVVVAFGPGLKMLTMDSKVANRLEKATGRGVEFRACGMTMKKLKLKDSDLYPSSQVKRVNGGVIEIMRLQNAGYVYIRP
ncbi:MAG: DsrE family protein [Thioalkalispiraceae bacterium]|jgi:intracellular sulfur oxidation DsrE/DsrF family protein